MANDPASGQAGDPAASPSSALLSPAERSRLAQTFQAGTKNLTANADYAIEMYTACVVGDPGNAVYLQAFLGILRKKHPPKKSGGLASLFGGSKGGGLWKKVNAGQHRDVIKQGVDILKANPYDSGALLAMAEACAQLAYSATRQVYLKSALDAAPADPEVNRHCAKFAAEIGECTEHIVRLVATEQRVENVKRARPIDHRKSTTRVGRVALKRTAVDKDRRPRCGVPRDSAAVCGRIVPREDAVDKASTRRPDMCRTALTGGCITGEGTVAYRPARTVTPDLDGTAVNARRVAREDAVCHG